jgi:hypothetical protein
LRTDAFVKPKKSSAEIDFPAPRPDCSSATAASIWTQTAFGEIPKNELPVEAHVALKTGY